MDCAASLSRSSEPFSRLAPCDRRTASLSSSLARKGKKLEEVGNLGIPFVRRSYLGIFPTKTPPPKTFVQPPAPLSLRRSSSLLLGSRASASSLPRPPIGGSGRGVKIHTPVFSPHSLEGGRQGEKEGGEKDDGGGGGAEEECCPQRATVIFSVCW